MTAGRTAVGRSTLRLNAVIGWWWATPVAEVVRGMRVFGGVRLQGLHFAFAQILIANEILRRVVEPAGKKRPPVPCPRLMFDLQRHETSEQFRFEPSQSVRYACATRLTTCISHTSTCTRPSPCFLHNLVAELKPEQQRLPRQ